MPLTLILRNPPLCRNETIMESCLSCRGRREMFDLRRMWSTAGRENNECRASRAVTRDAAADQRTPATGTLINRCASIFMRFSPDTRFRRIIWIRGLHWRSVALKGLKQLSNLGYCRFFECPVFERVGEFYCVTQIII